jgi:hypothetical protein
MGILFGASSQEEWNKMPRNEFVQVASLHFYIELRDISLSILAIHWWEDMP